MKTYEVINPVKYKDEIHKPGVSLELNDKVADPLLAIGAIREAGGAKAAAETGPKGEARVAAIIASVRALDPDNPKHFTKAGEPKVDAIEDAAGFQVSADERDAAWAAVKGEREEAGKKKPG